MSIQSSYLLAAVTQGQSVFWMGKLITKVADVPSQAQMDSDTAAGAVASATNVEVVRLGVAIARLQAEQAALIARLSYNPNLSL
jgi:hypothetical protein